MGIWGRLHICFQQLLQIQEREGGKVRKLLASELIHFIYYYSGQSFAPFCNIASQTDFNCTIDRSSMSICNLGTYSADIAAEYQVNI